MSSSNNEDWRNGGDVKVVHRTFYQRDRERGRSRDRERERERSPRRAVAHVYKSRKNFSPLFVNVPSDTRDIRDWQLTTTNYYGMNAGFFHVEDPEKMRVLFEAARQLKMAREFATCTDVSEKIGAQSGG